MRQGNIRYIRPFVVTGPKRVGAGKSAITGGLRPCWQRWHRGCSGGAGVWIDACTEQPVVLEQEGQDRHSGVGDLHRDVL